MVNSTREFFDTFAKILLRCWICGFVLLSVWLGVFMSNIVHKVHGPLVGLSDHELDVFHYCGIVFLKLIVLMFFFVPWLSTRLVLRKVR